MPNAFIQACTKYRVAENEYSRVTTALQEMMRISSDRDLISISSNVATKLPRELRDMVYSHLTDFTSDAAEIDFSAWRKLHQ